MHAALAGAPPPPPPPRRPHTYCIAQARSLIKCDSKPPVRISPQGLAGGVRRAARRVSFQTSSVVAGFHQVCLCVRAQAVTPSQAHVSAMRTRYDTHTHTHVCVTVRVFVRVCACVLESLVAAMALRPAKTFVRIICTKPLHTDTPPPPTEACIAASVCVRVPTHLCHVLSHT